MTIPNTMPRLYRISRKHVVPGTTVVLLSDTTKMDCPSWGIPAITYCPWAGECRFFCYAKKAAIMIRPYRPPQYLVEPQYFCEPDDIEAINDDVAFRVIVIDRHIMGWGQYNTIIHVQSRIDRDDPGIDMLAEI